MPWPTSEQTEVREWIATIEERTARFVGSEFCAARLIAHVSREAEMGDLPQPQAAQLLKDAYELAELLRLGHQAHKWLRRPPADLVLFVYTLEKSREE